MIKRICCVLEGIDVILDELIIASLDSYPVLVSSPHEATSLRVFW